MSRDSGFNTAEKDFVACECVFGCVGSRKAIYVISGLLGWDVLGLDIASFSFSSFSSMAVRSLRVDFGSWSACVVDECIAVHRHNKGL